MKKLLFTFLLCLSFGYISGQTVIFTEDFNGAAPAWTTENAPGSKTNPTPIGIAGLSYLSNSSCNNYFVINDANTPENSPPGPGGTFVRGRTNKCPAPNNLPNPDPGSPIVNKSLHITYRSCIGPISDGLLIGGSPSPDYDDQYGIVNEGGSQDVNSEQYAFMNTDFSTLGRCNLKIRADYFLGGDQNYNKTYGTILYSTDMGATWKILKDNIGPTVHFLAGTCNNWERLTFDFPTDAENKPNVRLAFRWRNDGNIGSTGDYTMGAGFNVDNIQVLSYPPQADFRVDKNPICQTDIISIRDTSKNLSGPTVYAWSVTPMTGVSFAHSSTSSSQHPYIKFDVAGTYTLTLQITNCGQTSTKSITVVVNNCVDFTAKYTNICATTPTPVSGAIITDTLIPNVTWPGGAPTSYSWSITGPGTVTYVNSTSSTSMIPQVQFGAPGTYTVTLTATNGSINGTTTKTAYITAGNCECGTGSAGPCVPGAINFTNVNVTIPTVNTGTNGSSANIWYFSDQESGTGAGNAGNAGCGIPTWHIGSTTLGDIGAAYDAGSTFLCSFFGICTNTDISLSTGNISTIGCSNLSLSFEYIHFGQGTTDNASVYYSANGGVTWAALPAIPKSSCCTNVGCATPCITATCNGSRQGRWTVYTTTLPPACNNISNLRIAFRWVNNQDGVGTDPSFAFHNISLTGTSSGPTAKQWTGVTSDDWHVASNWTPAGVPTTADDVEIPATLPAGRPMPYIYNNNAVCKTCCNKGTITICDGTTPKTATRKTLTVHETLINQGTIRSDYNGGTTGRDTFPDVILDGTLYTSKYRGSGLNIGVDYKIQNAGGAQKTTLEAGLSCRSMVVEGNFDLNNLNLTLKKSYNHVSGTVSNPNSLILDAAGAVSLDGDGYQVITATPAMITYPNLVMTNTAGTIQFKKNFTATNSITLSTANPVYVDDPFELHLSNNAPAALTRTNGHVVGWLKRAITGTNSYNYPVGSPVFYELANLNINAALAGVSTVRTRFNNVGNPTTAPVWPVIETPIIYQQYIPGPGWWQMEANATPGSGNFNITVFCQGFATPANFTYLKKPTGAPNWTTAALAGSPAGTVWPEIRRTGMTGFSGIAPIMDIPLPVEATPLYAQLEGNSVALRWQTFTERNNAGFIIERGQDGSQFTEIGYLAGAGTTTEPQHYLFRDRNIVSGQRYYYRYRQQDFDGSFKLSNICEIVTDALNIAQLRVYPNPARQHVQFDCYIPEGTAKLQVFDGTGKVVYNEALTAGNHQQQIDLNGWPKGAYLYRFTANDQIKSGILIVE